MQTLTMYVLPVMRRCVARPVSLLRLRLKKPLPPSAAGVLLHLRFSYLVYVGEYVRHPAPSTGQCIQARSNYVHTSQKCIGFDMAADVLHRCQVGTSVAYGAYGTHQLPQITAAAHTRARGIQGVKLQACFVKEMLMA